MQLSITLLDEIEQASRGCHQDFHAVSQCLDLTIRSDPAIDRGAPQLCPYGERPGDLMDLFGQLTRRRDDERARIPTRTIEQLMEDGQDKGGCLAGACLGGADNVTPAQGSRNGCLLDRRRGLIARVFDPLHQAGIQIKLFEVQNCSLSSEVVHV